MNINQPKTVHRHYLVRLNAYGCLTRVFLYVFKVKQTGSVQFQTRSGLDQFSSAYKLKTE